MDFPKKERGQITDVSFILKRQIFMNQKPAKGPTGFEDNLGTCVAQNFADEVAKTCLCYQ